MTDAERRIAIRELIQENTKANTVNQKVALQSLIDQGFVTPDGKLRSEFVEPKLKKAKAAA
jgi:hypothetical protein